MKNHLLLKNALMTSLMLVNLLLFCRGSFSDDNIPSGSTTVPATQIQRAYHVPMLLQSDFDPKFSSDPMLRIAIAGRSYWFAVDTASGRSILKASVQQEAGLKRTIHPLFMKEKEADWDKPLIIDGSVWLSRTGIDFGKFTVPDFPFTLYNNASDQNSLVGSDATIGGVIGTNILERFAVSFDYDRRQFGLYVGGKLSDSEVVASGYTKQKAVDISLISEESGHYSVRCLCNGTPIDLILDTGATTSVIQVSPAQFGLDISNGKKTEGVGFFGRRSGTVAPVSISLDGIGNQKVSAVFVSEKDRVERARSGVLGHDFLMRYNFLIDFPARKMYLRPRKDFKQDDLGFIRK